MYKLYLKIIPRTRVRYELLDCRRVACQVFGHFEGKVSVIKLQVSFHVWTNYRNGIYTVSREPIKLPGIQHLVYFVLVSRVYNLYVHRRNPTSGGTSVEFYTNVTLLSTLMSQR